MTRPVTRKMAVYCLLYRFGLEWHVLVCTVCNAVLKPEDDIEFDHIHADVFNGPHEYQNLRPVHKDCHKRKTKKDIAANNKIKRIRGERKPKPKRLMPSRPMTSGAKPWPKRKMQSRPFQKRAK